MIDLLIFVNDKVDAASKQKRRTDRTISKLAKKSYVNVNFDVGGSSPDVMLEPAKAHVLVMRCNRLVDCS